MGRLEQVSDRLELVSDRLELVTGRLALVADRLDLADRDALPAHRERRRVLAEIDAADDALHLRRDGDRLAVGARGIDRNGVGAVRPGHAVGALAVPSEGLRSGIDWKVNLGVLVLLLVLVISLVAVLIFLILPGIPDTPF